MDALSDTTQKPVDSTTVPEEPKKYKKYFFYKSGNRPKKKLLIEVPKESLLEHHDQKHAENEGTNPKTKMVDCEVCKQSIEEHDLRDHLRTHIGHPYVCHVCGREFRTITYFRRHSLTHSNTKTYVCKKCYKTFVRKSYLWMHNRLSHGAKPYRCQFCGLKFAYKTPFIQHMKTHDGEYICSVCKYRCKSRFFIQQHFDQHSKPFVPEERKPQEDLIQIIFPANMTLLAGYMTESRLS